ncbi:WD40-repeat-containing domain protein [Limtongia smithiae]|uniref:WD40-repeat-containing domain protein n=1 Tax=Limtongia smithiae TaxID=1125753 RepID=UPI0034CE807C
MATIGSLHNDMIHDAQLDYYGKRLATCSSDKTIKIFEIDGENHKLVDTLQGHDGPVWQLSWAHPKFGSILASASYDGKVLIWREDDSSSTRAWANIATHATHTESVNTVQWAPPELGAVLICGSSDGSVSVVEFSDDGSTNAVSVPAHSGAVYAVAWAANAAAAGTVGGATGATQRFVTGGSDGLIKIWHLDHATSLYTEESVLEATSTTGAWIRDIAWAPSVLPKSYLASASDDGSVLIWTQEQLGQPWKKTPLTADKFPNAVWRVSWSLSGNVLAVSSGENKISLWKENLKGGWEQCGSMEE